VRDQPVDLGEDAVPGQRAQQPAQRIGVRDAVTVRLAVDV
jgi:hypothetical protein